MIERGKNVIINIALVWDIGTERLSNIEDETADAFGILAFGVSCGIMGYLVGIG